MRSAQEGFISPQPGVLSGRSPTPRACVAAGFASAGRARHGATGSRRVEVGRMLALGERRERAELSMPMLPANLGEDCMESVFDEHELDVWGGEYPKPHGGDVPVTACDEDSPGHGVLQSGTRSGGDQSAGTGAEDAFQCSGPLRESTAEFEFADDLVGCTAFEAGRQHHRSLHGSAMQPLTARG